MADLGVNIGLNCVNVTLKALPVHNQSSNIDYNERFYWIGSSQMKHEYHNALVKVQYSTVRMRTISSYSYMYKCTIHKQILK